MTDAKRWKELMEWWKDNYSWMWNDFNISKTDALLMTWEKIVDLKNEEGRKSGNK